MSFYRRITCALIAVLLFSGVSYASILLDRIVAIVNKEVITWGELYRAMDFKVTEEFKTLGDAEKRKVLKESEASFLEGMIDTRLQVQAAKKLDIDASKEEIAEAIEGIRKKYSMGEKEFRETLVKEGFSIEEYKKLLAEQIILSKVVSQQVRSKIIVTDSEVDEYIAKNKSGGYRIRQIFLKKPEKDPDTKALEARAEEIQGRLKAGEDFTALARQYSDDHAGKMGGDLGFIKKELLGREFLEVLSTMNVGDVSRPFWTDRGLHIIRLEDKEDAKDEKELREIAKRKLFEKRFTEDYKVWIKSLREKAYVEVKL